MRKTAVAYKYILPTLYMNTDKLTYRTIDQQTNRPTRTIDQQTNRPTEPTRTIDQQTNRPTDQQTNRPTEP
jgi:hypothetical protein